MEFATERLPKQGPSTMPSVIKAITAARPERWAIDWTGIWAFCLGAVALSVASYVYFIDEAPLAAAFVLGAFAAILGVVLHESAPRQS